MAPLQRSKSAIQADQLQIQHFIHQHVLHKLYMTSEFNCDGCNTGGYSVRYRCSACDFDLHEQCATAPHRVSANIHPHHHLILVNRPGYSHFCHVCKGVTNGLSYTCEIQLCQFNVHTLCTQITVATKGQKSLTLDQQMQSNSQPMMVNHLQHQQQQMQGMHTMQLGGYNGANTSQPVMINNNQTHMINHHHHQQQQVKPMTGYGGYHGGDNSRPMMVNHHHHQQQQQGLPTTTTTFGGYHGGMNSQPMMVNHHQQQQVLPNNNQQFVTNHHQHLQQQQVIGIPPTAVGGYNQSVMISNPPPPPKQESNVYAKVGKLAANIVSTSLIGVPIFMSRK